MIMGQSIDLSSYPARKGYKDLVLLVFDPSVDVAWTAVTFPGEGYVWTALKDPLILKHTVFWLYNGGRNYPPWAGRLMSVMGLKEVTSFFHYGLSQSVESNLLADQGQATCFHLDSSVPMDLRYIVAVAEIPQGFDCVEKISMGLGESAVQLRSTSWNGSECPT